MINIVIKLNRNKKEYLKQYYLQHKEKQIQLNKKYREQHKEQIKEYHKKYYREHKEKINEYYKEHKEQHKKSQKRYVLKTRLNIIEFLGGKCIYCGFSDYRALQIDHINGHGCNEFARLGARKFYKKVKEHPELYQLLCANCNWIKRYENKEVGGRKIEK